MYNYITYIVHGGSNNQQTELGGTTLDISYSTVAKLCIQRDQDRWKIQKETLGGAARLVMKTRWDFTIYGKYMENIWNIYGTHIWLVVTGGAAGLVKSCPFSRFDPRKKIMSDTFHQSGEWVCISGRVLQLF
jgi:hypothetical protein